MLKRTITIAAVLAALATGLAACGGYDHSSSAASTAARGSTNVTIKDNSFSPAKIRVARGDTVTFKNEGAVAHTVTATRGAKFDSGGIEPGASFTFTAKKAGTVTYVCTIHPGMSGTIEVG